MDSQTTMLHEMHEVAVDTRGWAMCRFAHPVNLVFDNRLSTVEFLAFRYGDEEHTVLSGFPEIKMQTGSRNCSFSVFPFLKTSGPVSIGQLTFRSTDTTDGLSAEQAACVNEIADMLFLKDNLRIKSASYAVVPFVDLNRSTTDIEHLVNVQAVVAYCYALPRHEFGDLFLSSEHASMAIFTPSRVSAYLVRPDSHVVAIQSFPDLVIDDRGEVEGYAGLYNFRHHFWVAKGSRIFGPKPDLILNRAQDLCSDLERIAEARVDHRLLSKLLRKPDSQISSRIFTAIRWFNTANNEASDDASAIVDLSIAFESLLSLPRDEKTDRLTDAISLLLGRTPRLDIWVRQFYDARSRIVHEGRAQQLRFVATDSQKKGSESALYQSLLSYGREVFQLCLGTLLTGADLAERTCLKDKLSTNQERFQKVCEILADKTIGSRERFECVVPIVAAIERYRYVPENGPQLKTMIDATRLAARAFLEHAEVISQEMRERLERLTTAKRTDDHFEELEALQALDTFLPKKTAQTETSCFGVVHDIMQVVWSYAFTHYFWLRESRLNKTQNADGQAEQGE